MKENKLTPELRKAIQDVLLDAKIQVNDSLQNPDLTHEQKVTLSQVANKVESCLTTLNNLPEPNTNLWGKALRLFIISLRQIFDEDVEIFSDEELDSFDFETIVFLANQAWDWLKQWLS